jgi:membrane associated rhomboid family serine protease
MGTINRQDDHAIVRSGGFFARLTPMVRWLMLINVALFLADHLLLPLIYDQGVVHRRLIEWGAFSVADSVFSLRLWQFITFQFLHDSLGHLLFNSIGLYFFGPWVERWWGAKRFLMFYLLCGCGGALLFTALNLAQLVPGGPETGLIGASAGIYGILIGTAIIAPNLRVMLLIPPIELSMRQLAIALMALSVAMIVIGFGGNEGGEAGHLGGAIVGFLLMRFPQLIGSRGGVRRQRPKFSIVREAKIRPRSHLRLEEDPETDRIIDKISREGFHSLTAEEKQHLHQASQRPTRQS